MMDRESQRARIAKILLLVYWLAMFVGTHIPRSVTPPGPSGFDKLLHLAGFGGLAWLLAWTVSRHRRLPIARLIGLFCVVAAYGVVDELTQIPVGRDGSVYDWLADLMGGAAGIGVFLLARQARK